VVYRPPIQLVKCAHLGGEILKIGLLVRRVTVNNGHFAGIVQADGDDQGVRQESQRYLRNGPRRDTTSLQHRPFQSYSTELETPVNGGSDCDYQVGSPETGGDHWCIADSPVHLR